MPTGDMDLGQALGLCLVAAFFMRTTLRAMIDLLRGAVRSA